MSPRLRVCFLLLLALSSVNAFPQRIPGLMNSSDTTSSRDPSQDSRELKLHIVKNVQISTSHAIHDLRKKLSAVTRGTIDKIVHRPIHHGLDLISSVKGFVHKAPKEPFTHSDYSPGHLGVGYHFGVLGQHHGHNHGFTHHLDLEAEFPQHHHHSLQENYDNSNQFSQGVHLVPTEAIIQDSHIVSAGTNHKGSHTIPLLLSHVNGSYVIGEGHFNGDSHQNSAPNLNHDLHHVNPSGSVLSLIPTEQNSQQISSTPNNQQLVNQIGQGTVLHSSVQYADASHNLHQGSHSLTPDINNFGSQLASSIQKIIDSHLESTVQKNQAAHDAFPNQPKPCPNCDFPIKQTPEITQHIHIDQPHITIMAGTHVEITNPCAGNNEDKEKCKSGPDSSLVNPLKPVAHNSAPAPSPELSGTITEEQENENLTEVNDSDIVFIDDTKDFSKAIGKPENDDIDIRFGSENNANMSVNIRT
uniref:C2H2-type domain-containing protein n=1 Tax=Homalodisca liturata TaxID=320908 RepID=A0A1B6JPY5_9HEMI